MTLGNTLLVFQCTYVQVLECCELSNTVSGYLDQELEMQKTASHAFRRLCYNLYDTQPETRSCTEIRVVVLACAERLENLIPCYY